MPENYDNPPASSPRPSLPSESGISGIRRRQQLLDHLRARHQLEQSTRESERAASEEDDSELDGLIADVHFGGPISQLLDQLAEQDPEGTPRDNHPQRPRDRMVYLRNLIHSEAHQTDSETRLRALETLNREIEDHYLDQARNGNMTFMQAQAALDEHRRLFGAADNPRSATPTFRQYLQRLPSTVSPANLEPRTPSNRTIRRRPFRPGPRESFPTPSLMQQNPSSGRDRDRDRELDRRLKRRKLDSDDNREGRRGFNYGHQGQVVPGPLKMEVDSCDGGTYDTDGDYSFPDNVLRNDQSVYSTKSDRCNLILRHKDGAPFCLKKIVIKAPRASFDTPIQEGMIFVAMTSDELLKRTAQYEMQYSNRRQRRRDRRPGMRLPSQEYLNPSARHPLQATNERTVLVGPDSNVASSLETGGRDTPDPQTEFRITTDYDDTAEDNVFANREEDDMLPSVAELERVNEDDDLLASDSEDDSASDDDEEDNSIRNLVRRRRMDSIRRQALESSQRRRPPPSLVDPIPPHSYSTPPVIPASNAEVLKPYARFFIEREKSMVSIKFDPPPSGQFILIKLWSPRSGTNIDVQSIIAYGYGGPRFFPSGGFR